MQKFVEKGSPESKLQSAIQGLLIDHPHLAVPLLRLDTVFTTQVDLMGTDGSKLYVNPDEIDKLRAGELRFVLCHESGHLLGQHHFRQSGRNTDQWNVATDLNINSYLIELAGKLGSNLIVPDRVLSDPSQVNDKGQPLSPEKIYANNAPDPEQPGDNPDESKGDESNDDESQDDSTGQSDDSNDDESRNQPDCVDDESTDDSSENGGDTNPQNDESGNFGQSSPENGSDSDSDQSDTDSQNSDPSKVENTQTPSYGGCGAIMPANDDESAGETDPENNPESWASTATQAAAVAKSQGLDSGAMTALFGDHFSPRTNWRQKLARFFSGFARDDYSWKKPNRKYLGLGLVAPGLQSTGCGHWVLGLDVSGSMSGEIKKCVAHMNRIFETVQPEKVTVVYVDSAIKIVDTFQRGEKIILREFVAGGTDFRPLFQYVKDQRIRPEGIVFFTDCYGNWPDKKPRYPVVVATTEAVDSLAERFVPPKGCYVVDVAD